MDVAMLVDATFASPAEAANIIILGRGVWGRERSRETSSMVRYTHLFVEGDLFTIQFPANIYYFS